MPVYAPSTATASPAGTITEYGASTAPTGWLVCDGSAVSRTTYSVLFGIISTTYGVGDNSTTFNLPDMRGRMPVGLGTHADANAMAENDGTAVASRTPKHKHTVNDAGHVHTENQGAGASVGGPYQNWGGSSDSGVVASNIATGSATTGVTVGPQSTTPTDTPAYMVVQYIIKT